jgi:ABC-type dipeptide/oligopeptide/nickel transport system permease component
MAYLNSFPYFFLALFTTAVLNTKINITALEGTAGIEKAEILSSVSHHVVNHF